MRYCEFLDNVIRLGIDNDGEIGRQCPGSCGPDGNACTLRRARRSRATNDRKFDVNGGVISLLIFHFRLGEGGLREMTPPFTSNLDRKSTRLNSSHLGTSYARICLQNKTTQTDPPQLW